MLLAVGFHIELHWEATVVINLVFLHRVKVELKALKLQEKDIRQSLD